MYVTQGISTHHYMFCMPLRVSVFVHYRHCMELNVPVLIPTYFVCHSGSQDLPQQALYGIQNNSTHH